MWHGWKLSGDASQSSGHDVTRIDSAIETGYTEDMSNTDHDKPKWGCYVCKQRFHTIEELGAHAKAESNNAGHGYDRSKVHGA